MSQAWSQQVGSLRQHVAAHAHEQSLVLQQTAPRTMKRNQQSGLANRREILALVRARPTAGILTQEVANEVGMSREGVFYHLKTLLAEGLIRRPTSQSPWFPK